MPGLADEDYCYLTTTGRVSGEPREIEIWFALSEDGQTLYMLSGGGDRSNWVRNLMREPRVSVRIADTTRAGSARVVDPASDEAAVARRLVAGKYGRLDSDWGRTGLPVAVDFDG